MANSQESGLVDSFNSLGTDDSPQQIKHYEGLVARELGRVHGAYVNLFAGIVNPASLAVYNQLDIRQELWDQLQSKRLPALRREVQSLSRALTDPPDLYNKPIPKMKLVLKILSKIDATMGKIKLVIACVGPRLVRGDIRHDKDFKNLKIFNCHRIADCIYIINDKVCELLETYRLLIEESGHIFDHQSESVDDVLMRTFTCSFWIDGTIEGMDRWELHHVQDEWRTGLDSINETLAVFYQFVAACSEEHNAHLIRVKARSVIAALKIARLLLGKLLEISKDTKNFRMRSDLTSRELDVFVTMTNTLAASFRTLVYSLSPSMSRGQDNSPMIIQQSLSHLQASPRVILLMMNSIFLPVLDRADDFPSPIVSHKVWFRRWNNLHNLAIRVFHGFGYYVPLS
ncbi:hypothetical protein Pst134EA_006975 [Puccinia striiformis f. sp. tritici]